MKSEWSRRLERRFGAWAFPQLAGFIVFMNAAIWLLSLIKPQFPSMLTLNPAAVMHGEIWRIFTFLFVPPGMQPLWMFFWLYLLYMYANALEQAWGDFQFNLFYGIGALAVVAASFFLGEGLSNAFLNASLFLAFATLFPDFELLIFFILPVKVKWLAILLAAGMGWSFLTGDIFERWAVAAGLVNYVVFFGPELWAQVWLKVQVWRNRRRFRS